MELYIKTEIEDYPYKIGRVSRLVTIGSCFAETIGNRLAFHKFKVLNNPFGTIFNPVSVFELLSASFDEHWSDEALYVRQTDLWYHHLFHGSFSSIHRSELDKKIRESLDVTRKFLREADFLIITFGTALIYTLKSSGRVVSNCHKMSSELFEKSLLSPNDVVEVFERFRMLMDRVNARLRYIFTVSPVRHTRDTLPLNSVSKAVLLLACKQITETFDRTIYFPAFEIMNDELRDYRFYAEDMIHPTVQAQDYIFDRFQAAFWDEESRMLARKWEKMSKALSHRPFHPQSEAYKKFLVETVKRLEALQSRMNVSEEIEQLNKRITEFTK